MTITTPATQAYRAARDLLFSADSYEQAVATFEWPQLGDSFNWAIDWFDVIARGNEPVARLAPRDSGAIKPVTLEEILAWRHEGHKY